MYVPLYQVMNCIYSYNNGKNTLKQYANTKQFILNRLF